MDRRKKENFMDENEYKKRSAIWLYPQTFKNVDDNLSKDNCKNRSEFIEKAIDFYIGYINSTNSTNYLSDILVDSVKGVIKSNDNRMANNIFRLAVEVSVMMNIMAFGLEISEEQLRTTRARCIEEIKRNRGRVALEDAIEHQNS
ncbi:MAG: hypothetical protein R3Y35_11590 [Clostridia bacterium]